MSSDHKYIHGYTSKEQERLVYQNDFLSQFIYDRIDLSGIKNLLEVGCGVGAQMAHVFKHYPEIKITGVDISAEQLETADKNLQGYGVAQDKYNLVQADVAKELSLSTQHDGLIMIWVLEHVPDQIALLKNARQSLKPGSPAVFNEVYDSSWNVYPQSPTMSNYWKKSMDLKTSISGDADVGIRLYELLDKAGFKDIRVKPYNMHLDKSKPKLRAQMFDYWIGLLESSLEELLKAGLVTKEEWTTVIEENDRLKTNPDAVFFYTFFQAFATA